MTEKINIPTNIQTHIEGHKMKAVKKAVEVEFEFAEEDGTIETLEGRMKYRKGDAIITGVRGEKYPCRRDIFDQTYDIIGVNEDMVKGNE